MHFNEGTKAFDVFAYGAACRGVGRDRGTDCNAAVLCNLRGHIADTTNVEVAVFFGEAKLA